MIPRVSVIIPMHNAEPWIGDALASLRRQTIRNWEALVIDDGSSDRGPLLAEEQARRDPRIIPHRTPRAGVAAARNLGIARARGDYLLFLDADDWLTPGALERLLTAAAGTGASYGATAWHARDGRPLGYATVEPAAAVGLDELLSHNRFTVHAQMIRADLLAGERFDPSLRGCEDYDLWLRLAAAGVRWRAAGAVVGAYRCVPGSRSRDPGAVFLATRAVLQRGFELARNTGAGERGLDLSDERLRATLLRHALEAATAAVRRDGSPSCDDAASILAPLARPGCMSARLAAQAALWGVPLAEACAPNAWSDATPSWCADMDRWWRRCEREGWALTGCRARAILELARLSVDQGLVARTLAEEADPARPVVLVGFGCNGRRVARELHRRGLTPSAIDDAVPPPGRVESVEGRLVPVLPGSSPLSAEAQHIVTPSNDGPIVAHLPVCLDVRRWSEAEAEAARANAARLLARWPAPQAEAAAA